MKISGLLFVSALLISTVSPARGDEQESRDQRLMAVQEICPVSGEKLGEHGTPVKVKIGAEEVFLCCQGCAKSRPDPKHWATIHANFAKAQGICPVMKKELPKNPKWTIVEGRIAFVCCPPCIEKIQADPKQYLQEIDATLCRVSQEKAEVAVAGSHCAARG